MRPCREQTVWSDTTLVLLSFHLYAAAVDFSGLGFHSLFSKAQLIPGGHVLHPSLTTEDTVRELHHRKAILRLCPGCKA